MIGVLRIGDDSDLDAGHADVRLESGVDVLEQEVMRDELFDRESDCFRSAEEVEGVRVILRGVDPASDQGDFLVAEGRRSIINGP